MCWNTLYPAVFGQPAGDRPAGPDREAAACDNLLDEIPGAEGLRQLPEQGEQHLVFGSGVGSDLRHIAKSGDVVDDEGMGPRLGLQRHFVIEPVGRPIIGPLVLARSDWTWQVLVEGEGIATILRNGRYLRTSR